MHMEQMLHLRTSLAQIDSQCDEPRVYEDLFFCFAEEIRLPTNSSDLNCGDDSRYQFCDSYRAISPIYVCNSF